MVKPSLISTRTTGPALPGYVIVTPARNEARFIEITLQSVVKQTIHPMRWVIVSDGSTDGTDELVAGYAATYPWIELMRMPDRKERDFSGKVRAFNAGYSKVNALDYQVIASLDADISFEPDYFEFLLTKLANDSLLGLTGTPFQELSGRMYDYRFVNIEHVSGACQVFRRQCFESIGGYIPIKGGSIDHIAVISSRMKGWKTRTWTEKVCIHHREIGTAQRTLLKSRFMQGIKDYAIGNHPLWEMFRTGYQMTLPPIGIGGLFSGAGYVWAMLHGAERPVPPELIAFHRQEQLQRLRKFIRRGGSILKPATLQSPDPPPAPLNLIETTRDR
jgi:glycosyltransferase involved in cell wall biosynthesis